MTMNKTHGHSRGSNGKATKEYNAWHNMIQRCENPNRPGYQWWGGRGISVCKSWHKFENFFADMGECPKGLTLERIDNENGYKPDNCKWATPHEQNANMRPLSCGPNKQKWFYGHGPNGEMVIDDNQTVVAKIFNLTRPHISRCLSKQRKQHKGWTFILIDLTDKTVCDECAVFERVSGCANHPGSLLRERGCSK